MPAGMTPTVAIAVVAFCFCDVASAADGGPLALHADFNSGEQPRGRDPRTPRQYIRTLVSWKQKAARRPPADGDPYADLSGTI